ncbi:hypothetical protein SAMN05444851_2689 [Aliiroseovarius sediminilitoris]|uniref:Uncharacterized protein n=1 Tax=Aliiroseovarius sediminilitoris TaxID=1173584 RepID=A0A1I0QMJ3_9RHOB|nr:hypothetical protein [Aliiroseovarius sediminilitoris]SEW28328.1 hypothetical protein SAMN05444851_2689 [Aliiroseovarius sediminilitoris]
MRRIFLTAVILTSITLAGCQTTKTQSPSGNVTFCDRVIGWEPIAGENGAERAVTRAEVCSKPADAGVWMEVGQVHSKLSGRSFWLWMPKEDRHLTVSSTDGTPMLSGWSLQARPFGWAHEVVAVPDPGKINAGALPAGACPRKAVGKKPEKRYCIASN